MIWIFEVPGEPQGKGRARVGRVAGHARMFTPEKTVAYEGLVAMVAAQAMEGADPTEKPCALDLMIVFGVPASWSSKKRDLATSGSLYPAKKPDTDNVIKAVCDGMNGIVWRDDVQAVDVLARKRYGLRPGVKVVVRELA